MTTDRVMARYAPLAALAYPGAMLTLASVMLRNCFDLGCIGAYLLLLPAAPTAVVLVPLFGRGNQIGLAVAIITSLVAWALLGRLIASRLIANARGTVSWGAWWGRYVLIVVGWSIALVILAIVLTRMS